MAAHLLDGNFKAAFQLGANRGETVSLVIAQLTTDTLSCPQSASLWAKGEEAALGNGDLIINGAVVGAPVASGDAASTVDQSFSADNLIAASSRIQNAEFAAEKAALSRTQLLLQVDMSILAQAGAAPQQSGKDVPTLAAIQAVSRRDTAAYKGALPRIRKPSNLSRPSNCPVQHGGERLDSGKSEVNQDPINSNSGHPIIQSTKARKVR